MINNDRIVPVQATDLLTLYGTMLGISNIDYSVLNSGDILGNFTISEDDAVWLANQPVHSMNFGADVASATVFFIAGYDYSGIKGWATGKWERNKEDTKKYYEYIQNIKIIIEINFKKSEGHSGEEGNVEEDKIAKEADGIIDSDSYETSDKNISEKIKNIEEINKNKDEK